MKKKFKRRMKNSSRRKVLPEKQWEHFDEAMQEYKEQAIREYPTKGISKTDMISAAVGSFVLDRAKHTIPKPKVVQQFEDGEGGISMNMILGALC